MRRFLLAVILAMVVSGCGAGTSGANSVCAIDGGAQAGVPLTLTVDFGFSGCASGDARCTVTVDGGTILFATSATLCSTGNNPGGTGVTASCAVPPLDPGTYTLAPFTRTQAVVADGGGTSCVR